MKKLTLEEVGKLAGASRATVSRVINDPGSVSPELRERVQNVIAETGYHPNLAARSLASRRSNILGLIIPSVAKTLFADPYFPALIQGIAQACNASDYTLSLFIFHSREEQRQVYRRATGTGLIDGLIITADQVHDPIIRQLEEWDVPFVYIGHSADTRRVSYVDVDNVGGAVQAVTHLIRTGYRRIATVAGPQTTAAGLDRMAGYITALTAHNCPVDPDLIAYGDFTRHSGYTAMQQLLAHNPDAVFAASDTMALGVMQALQEAGLVVPGQVAVVGFDDLAAAGSVNPPLTTVRQPVTQTGTTAVEILIDILQTGPEPPRQVILPTELVIRASCGANKTYRSLRRHVKNV